MNQTPNQAAALHRAEINLTLNLNPNPTQPIPPHLISSLLSALRLLHAEACLLSNPTQPTSHPDDDRHIRRLHRLIRSIAPCTYFLQNLTPSADTRLVAASARVVAAFSLLRVAHQIDLVTALSAFVSLASKEPSTWRLVVLNNAVDVVPALHALLDYTSDLFCKATLPALPALIDIATECIKLVLVEPDPDKRDGMLGLAHIAVAVVAIVLHNRPNDVSSLQSHLERLSDQITASLPDTPDAQSLIHDVHHLLSLVAAAQPS